MSGEPFSREGRPLGAVVGCLYALAASIIGWLWLAALGTIWVLGGPLWFFTALITCIVIAWGGLYLWEKSR